MCARLVRSALLACARAGCWSGTALMPGQDGGGGGGDLAGADLTGAGNPDLTPPSNPCNTGPSPLDSTWMVHGMPDDRAVDVDVPASYDGKTRTPLVLNFHGYTSNSGQEALLSLMNAKSDAAGFIVAYPNGVASSWNAGACCGTAAQNMVDDVGFVRQLIDVISAQLCIDPKRVFSTGMSNGGFLSHRLGCELSDRIAAIAPVAGVLGVAACAPPRHVPVMGFHGTSDTLVPYGGRTSFGFPSVPETHFGWGTRRGWTHHTLRAHPPASSHL